MYSVIQYQESMLKGRHQFSVDTALPLSYETEDVEMRVELIHGDLSNLRF